MSTDTATAAPVVNYTHKHNGNVVQVTLEGPTREDKFGTYHLVKFVGMSFPRGLWADDKYLDLA